MPRDRAVLVYAGSAAVWLLAVAALDVATGGPTVVLSVLFALSPLIACAVLPARGTAVFAVLALALAVASGWWNGTWGTVQHQFGDADGLWAAVLAHISERSDPLLPPQHAALPDRVGAVVDMLWRALDSAGARAIHHLRLALPRDRGEWEAEFPRTAEALAAWDASWNEACERAFDGLAVDKVKLRRVRALLPGAMRGLHGEQDLSTYLDIDDAKRGLSDAVTAYLS